MYFNYIISKRLIKIKRMGDKGLRAVRCGEYKFYGGLPFCLLWAKAPNKPIGKKFYKIFGNCIDKSKRSDIIKL